MRDKVSSGRSILQIQTSPINCATLSHTHNHHHQPPPTHSTTTIPRHRFLSPTSIAMYQPTAMSPFYLEVRSASSVIDSLLEKVTASLSPSLLQFPPLILLEEGERKKARATTDSSLDTIDSTLAELASLISLAEALRDRVAKLRVWVAQPLSGIRALPEELLTEIFCISVNNNYCPNNRYIGWRMTLSIRHTCSWWRTVSDRCSGLWQDIGIRHPSQMPLLPMFTSRSGVRGLDVMFELPDHPNRAPWLNVDAKSISIKAQDAKNIRGLYIVDPLVLRALSFSPKSLDVFSPKWCSATFNQSGNYSYLNLPPYFLRASSIVLNGLPGPISPMTSSHLTALFLHRISQHQIEELLRISALPHLSFLRLKSSIFRGNFDEGSFSTRPPTILNSVETLELVFCENKFTHSLAHYVVLPRLTSLYFLQDEKDCDELGASAITPLLICFPLLARLALCMPQLRYALDVLQNLNYGLLGPKLPKLHSLKIVGHPEQQDSGLTDDNLDDLRSWVRGRLQASRSGGTQPDVHPLEELHLSKDFLGKHRGWYEENLPVFSLCEFSHPTVFE
ncbi:hypothetical protein DL93DRAFT_1921940 [Clavulina sp. PMI_390]|nr:hypothetical protein DL93DRAFT_1921940 [Clavulina sp. PMI_390]